MSERTIPSESADATDALLARFPGPVTLHASRLQQASFLALSIILNSCVTWYVWPLLTNPQVTSRPAGLFILATIILLWLMLIVGAALVLLTDLPRLTINARGFEFHHLFGVRRRGWDEVERFAPFLGLLIISHTSGLSFWQKINRELFLPNHFGLGAKKLGRVMTAWCERALAQR